MPKNYEALLNISRDIRSQSMVWRKQRNSAFATSNNLIFQNQTLKNSKWNQWGYEYIKIRKLFKFHHNLTKNKALASFLSMLSFLFIVRKNELQRLSIRALRA